MAQTSLETPAATASPVTEPRGFAPNYALATFGVFFAILPPTLGGLSIKLQQLVGIDHAAQALGLMMGAGLFFGPLAQPIIGRLSDHTTSRFGMRRPWLIAGALGFGAALTLVGLVSNLTALLVLWCVAQVSSNVVQGTLHATVADSVPKARLGVVAGLGGAAVPVAMLLSALSLNSFHTNEARLIVPALIGTALCLFFAFTLKDKVSRGGAAPLNLKALASSFWFNPVVYRDFGLAWLTKALIIFGFASISAFLTLFLASAFAMDVEAQLQFNLYATICSVAMMALGSAGGGWLSDKLGRRRVFVMAAGVLIGVGVAILAAAPYAGQDAGLILVLIAELFVGFGFGLFLSVDAALCIAVLPDPETKAKDLGVLNLANSVPGTLAPVLAGGLVIPFGNQFAAGAGYSLWFAIAAAIAVIGGLLVLQIRGVR